MAVQEFQQTAFSPHLGSYLIPLNTDIRLIVLILLPLITKSDRELLKYFFNFAG